MRPRMSRAASVFFLSIPLLATVAGAAFLGRLASPPANAAQSEAQMTPVTAGPPGAGSDKPSQLTAAAQLGRKMFFDPSLSGSGRLSCASCHSPANAFAPQNALPVQLGGPDLQVPGARATPTLTYLEHTPNFTIGHNPDMPERDLLPSPVEPAQKAETEAESNAAVEAAEANVPQGGFDWDGRADTLRSQALGPLLDPKEMDNHDAAEVLEHLKRAPYAEDFKQVFGPQMFDQPALALEKALSALERFQLEERSFHSYDSKYDAYLAGKANLSEAELHGLKLFEDPKKGNCSSCHIDRPSRDGVFQPAFTDYEFEALGAPRNRDIPGNRDPKYYDLGLCGPTRADQAEAAAYCGLFKTPTLRNVATRKVFFHNGVFRSLDEVMHFYVERETNPGKWYPKRANGDVDIYDDLPPEFKKNVDVTEAPFNRKPGDQPALNDAEIADVIAFLNTLTDGYKAGPTQTETAAGP